MVAAGVRHWRTRAGHRWNDSAVHALAIPPKKDRTVRTFASFVFAVALLFGVAPLCAAPVGARPMAAMPDCASMTGASDTEHDSSRHDPPPACHTCATPLGMDIRFDPALPWASVLPVAKHIDQLTSAALEPPTPPPRGAESKPNSEIQRS